MVIEIIVISLAIGIFLLASISILFLLFTRRGILEYAGLAVGFAMILPHLISEILLEHFIPAEPGNTPLMTKLMSSSIALLLLAVITIYLSLKSLTGSHLSFWQWINVYYSLIIAGSALFFITAIPSQNQWGIFFIPKPTLFLMATAVLTIVLRIIILLSKVVRGKSGTGKRVLFLGFSVLILSFLIAMTERNFSSTSNTFLIFYPFGLFFISLSVLFDPYLFIPFDHHIKFLLVFKKKDWEMLYHLNFTDVADDKYSRALQGSFQLLSALFVQETLPRGISFLNNEVSVIESKSMGILIISESIVLPPIRAGLSKVLEMVDDDPSLKFSQVVPRYLPYLFR